MDRSMALEAGEALNPPVVAPWARPVASRLGSLQRAAVIYLGALLLVSVAATLIACWFALSVPQQLDEGEPLIYGLAGRVLQHQALYQPIDQQPFVQVHYTPVYYLAVAALRRVVGSGFVWGRLLSLLSGLAAAALVGYLAATHARSRWAGGFAVLLFLGLGFPMSPAPFLALERVDVLGVAFAIATLAVLTHGTGRWHVLLAAALAALAIWTKQSLFAAGVAGALWLLTVDRRQAGLFSVALAVCLVVPALVLQRTSGGAFWDNVGPANPASVALPFGAFLFRELVFFQAAPALLALGCLVSTSSWRDRRLRLLLLYCALSIVSVVGILKVGANHNYWIEFAAANSVLATLAVWRCLRAVQHAAWAVVPVLACGILLTALTPLRVTPASLGDQVPTSWKLDLVGFRVLREQTAGFNKLVRDLQGQSGEVLAESLDAAVLSGHPLVLEPFAFSMLEHEGRWNSQPLVDDICSARVSLLLLVYPIETDIYPTGLPDFPMWPASVMAALRQAMQLSEAHDAHWFYRPRESPSASAVAACQAAAQAARDAQGVPAT